MVAFLLLALAACSDKWSFGSKGSGEPAETDEGAEPPPIPSVLAQPPVQRPAVIDMQGRPMSFAPLVAQADASVATVKAVQRGNVGGRERTLKEGLGTAFIYDPAGYLLTNHHVIEQATDITIGFKDGRDLPAKVVGSDKRTDVAVLKVDATSLPALPLGDSDELLVGDWVVAIGNPFGLAHTVSAGILSAKGRTRDDVLGLDPAGYFDFLQTDASINPGNSGGPLLNLKGEVVGINAAIRANANNIGFAIPINMVKQLLPLLLRDGKVRRSAIGVIVGDVTVEHAARLGRSTTKGAWVKGVQGGGPADKGGVAVDDVIVAFNGKPIDDQNQLRWYASISGVGQTATVRVLRDRKEIDLKVTLSELPESDN
ncbi:MAG: PDZ domain-containing protein [Polyangiaceae bacterium]|nr:PDZ domain-containing protein [Polyangiaceae bacterium]